MKRKPAVASGGSVLNKTKVNNTVFTPTAPPVQQVSEPGFITVLHAQDPSARCAKLLNPDGTTADKQRPGKFFRYERHPVNDLADIQRLLLPLESNRRALVIRGDLRPELDPNRAYARTNANTVDVARHWLCLDLDEREAPPGTSPTDPRAAAWLVRELLPAPFHDAAFVLQWSSSAGTAKAGRKVKCHLWFWLETKHTSAELRGWAESVGADAALFQQIQIHYTAAPVFVGESDVLTGPRTLFVREGLRPTVAFKPQPCAGYRVYRGGTSPGAPVPVVSVDRTGKIKDGREKLLRNTLFAAACDIRRAGGVPTADDIVSRAWPIFEGRADLGDGKWTIDECHRRALRLEQNIAEGRLPQFPAETGGLEPHWVLTPRPIDDVRRTLAETVEAFFHAGE